MQFEFNFKEKGMKLISFSAILRLNARILPQKDVINYLSHIYLNLIYIFLISSSKGCKNQKGSPANLDTKELICLPGLENNPPGEITSGRWENSLSQGNSVVLENLALD